MVDAAVGRFSGGEKARLTLALIVRQRPNLLLLDEPTNHLDIEMREALAEALQDYDGALVVVAHDRHLLRATTDALWLVADGSVAAVRRRSRRLSRLGAGSAAGDAGRRSATPDARGRPQGAEARGSRGAPARATRSASRSPTSREARARDGRAQRAKKALDAWLAAPAAYADAGRTR